MYTEEWRPSYSFYSMRKRPQTLISRELIDYSDYNSAIDHISWTLLIMNSEAFLRNGSIHCEWSQAMPQCWWRSSSPTHSCPPVLSSPTSACRLAINVCSLRWQHSKLWEEACYPYRVPPCCSSSAPSHRTTMLAVCFQMENSSVAYFLEPESPSSKEASLSLELGRQTEAFTRRWVGNSPPLTDDQIDLSKCRSWGFPFSSTPTVMHLRHAPSHTLPESSSERRLAVPIFSRQVDCSRFLRILPFGVSGWLHHPSRSSVISWHATPSVSFVSIRHCYILERWTRS